jgi:transposase
MGATKKTRNPSAKNGQQPAEADAAALRHLGVGIDTARFGHHVTFLREDKQPAAKPLSITESRSGYQQLQVQLEKLHLRHPAAHIHLRIDAAGQYATNLESFLRSLHHLPMTISVGEPKRNKDYHHAHSPKRQSDATESYAMARYAVVERPPESFGKPAAFTALRRVAARVQAQTKQSTRLTNQLHETLSASFPELAMLVSDISTGWVLELLTQYPTAERIAAARLHSLENIPYLKAEKAKQLHEAAKHSVGTFRGEVPEELIRALVGELRHSLAEETRWKKLLENAFDALPEGPHRQIVSIPGIGKQTAAAIVATAVAIERFETDNHLVGYYGVFPQELQSGVDKFGRPIPPGKKIMCRKGNDLVRGLLWQCAKCASAENGGNPAVRALYLRRLAAGDSPQIAWGYCMTKLLRQVFGVWSSDQPFNPQHQTKRHETKTEASGLKDESSTGKEVTEAPACLEPVSAVVAVDCHAPTTQEQSMTNRDPIDYAALREQVSFARVLDHLGQHVSGPQHRGPCPLHEPQAKQGRSFSVNLKRNAFRCFESCCRAQGNVLDFWSVYRKLPLYEAAVDLARTLRIQLPHLDAPTMKHSTERNTKAGTTPPST